MLDAYFRVRLDGKLDADAYEILRTYLTGLLEARAFPVYRGRWIDIDVASTVTGISRDVLLSARPHLQPLCDAISRAAADPGRSGRATQPRKIAATPSAPESRHGPIGRPRRPNSIARLKPLWAMWADPETFDEALRLHMARHGDSLRGLQAALAAAGSGPCIETLTLWHRGAVLPTRAASFAVLAAIESRYRLAPGYFDAKLEKRSRIKTAEGGFVPIPAAERRRLAWHLPDNFAHRPAAEQAEIIAWIRDVIISGSTDYRRFQAAASKQRYALRFPGLRFAPAGGKVTEIGHARHSTLVDAPEQLRKEMSELIQFKTSALTQLGLRRNGVWNHETAVQKVEHFGLMFGAFAADPASEIGGLGVELKSLTFAMLVFPAAWDWYLAWRERRRGFFTKWEADMLSIVLALVKTETGWLRQMPRIADHLAPIEGLISADEIAAAKADWDGACDAMHRHGRARIKEITRLSRVHRDPFEPILTILEAPSPLAEYRKITEEIVRLMPNENIYPKATSEAVRSFLMLRFGLHLGLRQRNLREMLVCPRGRLPSSERRLEELKRGEVRWSARDSGWEVLIPAVAFKNAHSSFFGSKPFRLVLPDLGGLYAMIEAWVDRHRARLIGPADDPGTFFIKTTKRTSANAAYDQMTFYEAWRCTIQRYGIYNPYTGRGAIEGLLPHGPHNVRDVLATHILKQTGSYEQASYAIQDTPDMIAQHYGRFLPQDKAAITAKILNQVWAAA